MEQSMTSGMEDTRHKRCTGRWNWIVFCAFCLLVCAGWVFVPSYVTRTLRVTTLPEDRIDYDSTLLKDKQVKGTLAALSKVVGGLDRKWDSYIPKSAYIVINTTTNQFRLYDAKGKIVREGFCSSGSYTKLILSEKKSWVFKTPKGRMPILSKTVNPVWAKPDWAFIEEGLPVPKPGDPSRFERGVLGDYALRMPDGYLIHGTLYKRFLGMPVTHGCVRMGDADLEVVYKTLMPGSYVYIY